MSVFTFNNSASVQPAYGCQAAPAAPMAISSRKRKTSDDSSEMEALQAEGRQFPRKISMPSRAYDGDQLAQFLPLDHEENLRALSSLGLLPGQQGAAGLFNGSSSSSSSGMTPGFSHSPTSAISLMHPGTPSGSERDYFHAKNSSFSSDSGVYPHLNPYPSVQAAAAAGQSVADEGMDVDSGATAGHGPQCKSIPQLFVRTEGGTASELWARCSDCGSINKVQAGESSTLQMCYSP